MVWNCSYAADVLFFLPSVRALESVLRQWKRVTLLPSTSVLIRSGISLSLASRTLSLSRRHCEKPPSLLLRTMFCPYRITQPMR